MSVLVLGTVVPYWRLDHSAVRRDRDRVKFTWSWDRSKNNGRIPKPKCVFTQCDETKTVSLLRGKRTVNCFRSQHHSSLNLMKTTTISLCFLFAFIIVIGESRLASHGEDDISNVADGVEQGIVEALDSLASDSDLDRTLASSSCTLCPSGQIPAESSILIVINSQRVSCAAAHQMGDLTAKIGASQCSRYREIGQEICLCQKGQISGLNSCTLCDDGSSITDPNRKVFGSKTCLTLANAMRRNLRKNCYVYKGVIGPYCGCNNSVSSAKVCHLCNTSKLPVPSRVVNGRSCLRYEFEASLANTCSATKQAVAAKCCS